MLFASTALVTELYLCFPVVRRAWVRGASGENIRLIFENGLALTGLMGSPIERPEFVATVFSRKMPLLCATRTAL